MGGGVGGNVDGTAGALSSQPGRAKRKEGPVVAFTAANCKSCDLLFREDASYLHPTHLRNVE